MRSLRVLGLTLSACVASYEAPATDAGPVGDAALAADGGSPGCNEHLAVLLVLDDSSDAMLAKDRFDEAVPTLLTELAGMGSAGGTSFRSVSLAAISTSMGTGGHPHARCGNPFFGDDAVIGARVDGCEGKAVTLTSERAPVECVMLPDEPGCPWEQPLEAALKAITPASSTLRFSGDTAGHADGRNAALFGPRTTLAVVVFGTQDDCSVRDDELFDPASERYLGRSNGRCLAHGDALHATQRYVDGLLRDRAPEDVVFLAITGTPESAAGASAEALLARDEMRVRPDPILPGRAVPACEATEAGLVAEPGRRVVEVAAGLERAGAGVIVRSVCAPTYAPAMRDLVTLLGARRADACRGPR